MYALASESFFLELRCMIFNKDQDFLLAFGKNLRKLRKTKELSQEALAHKVRTAPSQIGRIERGEINPTVSTVKALANALEIQIQDLFLFDYS